MDKILLYCDGGCRGNQSENNIGGWGAYMEYGVHKKEIYSGVKNTTNNRMELTACIEGLRAIKNKNIPIDVYLDSAYVLNGITSWINGWIKNGWRNSKKQPVENKDLWILLLEEKKKFTNINFVKVKGHSDNEGNNKADELANRGMDEVI